MFGVFPKIDTVKIQRKKQFKIWNNIHEYDDYLAHKTKRNQHKNGVLMLSLSRLPCSDEKVLVISSLSSQPRCIVSFWKEESRMNNWTLRVAKYLIKKPGHTSARAMEIELCIRGGCIPMRWYQPEHPRQPQCTHSTIFPASSFDLGTRQIQFVPKFVSLACIQRRQHKFS